LAKMRRSAGPVESLAIVVEWAASTPRCGKIGESAESFAVLVEELAAITLAHHLPFDTQRKLVHVLHDWAEKQGHWLQRLFCTNRKAGLAEKVQRLRAALDAKVQQALTSMENRLATLEPLESKAILDGVGGQDYESMLLRLDSELTELSTFVPAPFAPRLILSQNRLASIIARVDGELCRCKEVYAEILAAVAQASNRSALASLRIVAERQLPATMHSRPELKQAFDQAGDRLLLAELEGLELQERTMHLARLKSVRGVDLASLLFREYGVDLPTARKLVIDHNQGNINLDDLLDFVLEIQRQNKYWSSRTANTES